jgi:4-diphosphocytidyl-2-C-methyl-D-erythritol kinase
MIVRAPAKINLGLRVLRKREDGYHDIETVFHKVSLADTISIDPVDHGIEFSCSDTSLPVDGSNLCVQAARLLLDEAGIKQGVRMHLEKCIPHGAGLGGGSSDAAAVLKALSSIYKLDISRPGLHDIALKLGSDVPFFLGSPTAYATGRGEQFEPVSIRLPMSILIIKPDVSVSTSWAYRSITPRQYGASLMESIAAFNSGDWPFIRANVKNDFEDTVCAAYPEIAQIKADLYRAGAVFALLSGSGSAVFGIFDETTENRNNYVPSSGCSMYRVHSWNANQDID